MLVRISATIISLLLFVATANAQVSAPPAALPSVASGPRPLPVPHWHHAPAPPYLILRQASSGVAQPTAGHPYAYGWFGVAPRRHTIVHRGYYGGLWVMPGRIAP